MATGSAAFLLYFLRGHVPMWLSFVLGNLLMLLLAALCLRAYARLAGEAVPWGGIFALLAFGLTGVALHGMVSKLLVAFTVSIALAALLLLMVRSIERLHRPKPLQLARGTQAVYLVLAAALMLRATLALVDDGASVALRSSAAPQIFVLLAGGVFFAAGTLSFVSMAQELRRREIEESARRDPLTGIYNRAALFELVAELKRQPAAQACAVVMFDIDHFKAINDGHGHGAGDLAIAYAARIIASSARISDVVARYGGDEFCVILRNSGAAEAAQFARRTVEEARKQALRIDEQQSIKLTLSAGYAARTAGTAGAVDVEALIEQADRALYAAKQGGRDRAHSIEALAGLVAAAALTQAATSA
jgi:diguanylate cyclase (GGDEF)-like protein